MSKTVNDNSYVVEYLDGGVVKTMHFPNQIAAFKGYTFMSKGKPIRIRDPQGLIIGGMPDNEDLPKFARVA